MCNEDVTKASLGFTFICTTRKGRIKIFEMQVWYPNWSFTYTSIVFFKLLPLSYLDNSLSLSVVSLLSLYAV